MQSLILGSVLTSVLRAADQGTFSLVTELDFERRRANRRVSVEMTPFVREASEKRTAGPFYEKRRTKGDEI